MAKNYEYRFELKPGKHVYIPNDFTLKRGPEIVERLLTIWKPAPYFYHFGKRGGHVAAMRPHVGSTFKASVDLTGFFSFVTRAKICRSLKKIGYSSIEAFEVAQESCVEDCGRKFVPYGFPQSMALATLAAEKSALGAEIVMLRSSGVAVTMYVDDILLSSKSIEELECAYKKIVAAVERSNFHVSESKSVAPCKDVDAFNCSVGTKLSILDERMHKFLIQMGEASDHGRAAILRYVGVINNE